MKGLILFLTAKLLLLVFYPLGFTYCVAALFFKHGYYGAKHYFKHSNSTVSTLVAPWMFLSRGWKALDAYLFRCAIADDQHGNVYLAKALNDTMVQPGSYKFGHVDETVSSVLGKNQVREKLSGAGKVLNLILHLLERDHSVKSIEYDESH
jgi:hypothetical protein